MMLLAKSVTETKELGRERDFHPSKPSEASFRNSPTASFYGVTPWPDFPVDGAMLSHGGGVVDRGSKHSGIGWRARGAAATLQGKFLFVVIASYFEAR
jgi:hypothetical protein